MVNETDFQQYLLPYFHAAMSNPVWSIHHSDNCALLKSAWVVIADLC